MSRRWWRFWRDEYARWHGVPRDDIDLAELQAEWIYLARRNRAPGKFPCVRT